MNVQTTTNYDQFKFFHGNRAVNQAKVKQLASLIAIDGLKVPIIVNQNKMVIDGQHRLVACKSINEPIKYFVSHGATVEDAAATNQAGSNWTASDWINYHAALGNKEYQKLKDWIAVCKSEGITSVDLARFFAQNSATKMSLYRHSDGSVSKHRQRGSISIGTNVKHGTWKFGNLDKAYELLYLHLDFAKTASWASKANFVTTLIKVSRIKDFDAKWLLSQIEKYPQMWYNCATSDAFITMIEDIYNYRKARKNRLPIRNNPELEAR